jgi:hypothetical protein
VNFRSPLKIDELTLLHQRTWASKGSLESSVKLITKRY